MQTTYGTFTKEQDGHFSGQVLNIKSQRQDGKFSVTHAFGGGQMINKIYTAEQLAVAISKVEKTA